MNIYLTAIIKSKPEFLDEVTSVLENMLQKTRKEEACLLYNLHQRIEDKTVFVFYEIWADPSGLEQHNQQSYIKEFRELSKDKLQEPPQIYICQKL